MEGISTLDELIEEVRAGRMVILVDDEERENEGDLVLPAQFVTPESINFMAKYGRGLICLSITEERAKKLDLKLMADPDKALHGTAFTVSIDAAEGVTTGISAYDRAYTIKKVIDPNARPEDFARPGHVFPLIARPGGVLERAGHTEGSIDLMKMAGLYPAAVICEIMKEDGTMARLPDLLEFSKRHGIKLGTIADIIKRRLAQEIFIKKEAESTLQTRFGEFRLVAYSNTVNPYIYIALVRGELRDPTLVRVHRRCFVGETFRCVDCLCRAMLEFSMEKIGGDGGVLVYVTDGDGMEWKCPREGYLGDPEGRPRFLRDYGIGAQVLRDLGVRRMRVITAHGTKIAGLSGFGLEVSEVIIPDFAKEDSVEKGDTEEDKIQS